MTLSARNPYPGLRSFTRDETDIFFGRDDCIDAMLDRLRETRFLAVLGASGTGKSSIVKTGLLSALEIGLLTIAGSRWRVVELKPGHAPLENLARALLEAEHDQPRTELPISAIEDLRDALLARGANAVIEWSRRHAAETENVLLLVDQFEELFRYQDYAAQEEAEIFVGLLLESAQALAHPLYVTITMRSEYLGPCALIEGLAEAISAGMFLIPRMTRERCQEAIEGPARVFRGEVDGALVRRLLNDLARLAPWENDSDADQLDLLARRADQLPLLQYTLNRIWETKRTTTEGTLRLELADYEAVGALQGALDEHANQVFEELGKLGDSYKRVTETTFRALTTGTTAADAKRRPASLAELVRICGGEEHRKTVHDVIRRFLQPDCDFLTIDPGPGIADATTVDVTHESVIRQWKKLSAWVTAEADAARRWRRLKDETEQYRNETGEPLRGRRLRDVDAWWRKSQPNETWAKLYGNEYSIVRGFVDESKRLNRRRLSVIGAVTSSLLIVLAAVVYREAGRAHYESEAKTFEIFKPAVKKLASSVARGGDQQLHYLTFLNGILPILENSFHENEIEFARTQMYVLLDLAERERKHLNIENNMHSLVAAEHAEKYRTDALQLAERLAKLGSNYYDLKIDYANLKEVADALAKIRDYDHAVEVLDKAAMSFRSFEEATDDAWKWETSRDIMKIRYDQGMWLLNSSKWDEAIAVSRDGLTETDEFEKWPVSPLEKDVTWVLNFRSLLYTNLGIALWRKADEMGEKGTQSLKQQAINELQLAINALDKGFPETFKTQQKIFREKPDEWLARFDASINEKTRARSPEGLLLPDEAKRKTIAKTADLYEALGNLYASVKKPEEARLSYTLAFQERYNLVAEDDTKALEGNYDNEAAKRGLAQVLLKLGTLEGGPEIAVRFFKNCIAVIRDSATQSDSEKILGECYGKLAVALDRSKEDQSDELRVASEHARFFHDRALQDAELDQAFVDPDDLRRAAMVLVRLAVDGRSVLDQADRYAERRRLLAMRTYNESTNETHMHNLASAWAVGSWHKLLNQQPVLAELYARKALSLEEGDPLSPNSEAGRVASINLAHSLLFLDRIDEAQKIYMAIKDIKTSNSQPILEEVTKDFAILRAMKLTHPGICVIGKLLEDAAYTKVDCPAVN